MVLIDGRPPRQASRTRWPISSSASPRAQVERIELIRPGAARHRHAGLRLDGECGGAKENKRPARAG